MITPLNWETLLPLLPPRDRESHKGNFGHVLVVGGDEGYGGATLLAAEAAARCGAGLTSVATHPVHASALLARRPELMVRGVYRPETLEPLLKRASVVVLGPGLGQSEWSSACFLKTLQLAQQRSLSIVLDADGLNLLKVHHPQMTYAKWLLTPHPGEAGRLLDRSSDEINADREASVRELQARYGGAIILKGNGSLCCYTQQGRQRVEQCQHGNPGMASGGMGDVLSGVAGALLAQGFELSTATRLALCLHSKAADLAAAEGGERGLLASDLFPFLRQLLNP